MAKSSTFANDLLKLIFNGTPIANIADNASASPLTQLYVALHNADPGAGGNQSTNEVAYTGYQRVALQRTNSGWVVTGNQVAPAGTIYWPQGTGGNDTATFMSVGIAQTGNGKILWSGAISPSIACGNGVTPQATTATRITEV